MADTTDTPIVPEMVERLALAIGIASTQDWDYGMHWAMNPPNREHLRCIARAAIEAMREPTDKMIKDGWLAVDEGSCNIQTAWAWMIDAALGK